MSRILFSFLLATLVNTNVFPCTIFSVSDGTAMLVGNNEDHSYKEDYFLKVVPPRIGSFGRMVFLTKAYFVFEVAQGGMNDQGLFIDGATTPVGSTGNADADQSYQRTATFHFLDDMLATCKSVDEAIAYLRGTKFDRPTFHLFLADKGRRSAIVEWTGGSLKVVLPTQSYLIATNYLLTGPPPLAGDRVRETLVSNHVQRDPSVTVTNAGRMLYEAMQVGEEGGTLYSNVYDLSNLTMTMFVRGKWSARKTYSLRNLMSQGESMRNVKEMH